MIIGYRVFMNSRDVSHWVRDLEVRHPRGAVYRQFDAVFAGWNSIEGYQAGARWDIFGSHDESNPRAELLIRAGVVPPDRDRFLVVEREQVPEITVRGYDQVWLSQRRRPTETIVAIPDSGFTLDDVGGVQTLRQSGVEDALSRYSGPVGRYRVWQYIRTVGEAIRRLANEAGMNADVRIPNRELRSFVLPATRSYWDAIRDLAEPWAPEFWFRRSTNTLLVLDPESPRYQVGRSLNLSADMVTRVTARPVQTNRIRRAIVRLA